MDTDAPVWYNKGIKHTGEALPMFQVADWSRRKLEIADAFRQVAPLPAEAELMKHFSLRSVWLTTRT